MNMNLFDQKKNQESQSSKHAEPLAYRMRPQTLKDFINQKHILDNGKPLLRAIQADRLTSLILYGPPGVGKTALAFIISNITQSEFVRINAAASSVKELREIIKHAKRRIKSLGKRTIVFIDEIHRFNKAQQDVLMSDVEQGNIILIGATTYNPFFSIVPALVSRSGIYELKRLSEKDILNILKKALKDEKRGLGKLKIDISQKVLNQIAKISDGDARRALNILEVAALTTEPDKKKIIYITKKIISECVQKKIVLYDKSEDAHYDTISSFIKSMRASRPDAALYWLAKMIYAGEDPRFIARRIVICASEDVGNADPNALVLANSAYQAAEFVGMPEAKIPLAQAAIYVACAPKSNACYKAIEKALEDVEKGRLFEIPDHLKDAHYKGAKRLGRGKGYKYPHSDEEGAKKQKYIPKNKRYYYPKDSGFEAKIKKELSKKEHLFRENNA
jgi:putative ATPase